jgi:hypothetical protein
MCERSLVPVLVHGLQQRFDVFEFLLGGQDPVQQTPGVGSCANTDAKIESSDVDRLADVLRTPAS